MDSEDGGGGENGKENLGTRFISLVVQAHRQNGYQPFSYTKRRNPRPWQW